MITLLCPPMLGLWGWLNSDEVSSVWRFTGANLAHIRSKLSRFSSRYGWQPRSWLINCETFWTVTHSFSPSSHLEAMATVCCGRGNEQSSEPLFIVIRKSPSLYSDRIFLFSATKDIREWAGEVKLFFFCPFSWPGAPQTSSTSSEGAPRVPNTGRILIWPFEWRALAECWSRRSSSWDRRQWCKQQKTPITHEGTVGLRFVSISKEI